MDKHFSDLPTTPMPMVRPPRPSRPSRKLWLLVFLIASVLVIVGVGVGVVVALKTPTHTLARGTVTAVSMSNSSTATVVGNSQTIGVATSTATVGASVTAGARATATPHPGQSASTHGRPRLGGPLTDFVGKYGTPTSEGDANSLNFWTGTNQTIDLNVNGNDQGNIAQIAVLGADTWTATQTQSYCAQFLPDGAVQTSSSASLITYSSSAGTVDLELPSATSCSLAFARAK